jgi:unsaturated rhamnogalacturonyl hydrolase
MGTRWLRGNGWVALSIVEILDELPATHPRRPELERILRRLADGLAARQLANGLWDSIVDLPGACYDESSGSALVAYAFAKGARRGWLPAAMRDRARATFESLTSRLRRRVDGLSVTGTSGATNPTPQWIYELIRRKDDVDYGAGAYLLLATELATDTWVAP